MLFILIVVMISWVQRKKFCKNPEREVAKALYEMKRHMDNLKIIQPVVSSIFLSGLVGSWIWYWDLNSATQSWWLWERTFHSSGLTVTKCEKKAWLNIPLDCCLGCHLVSLFLVEPGGSVVTWCVARRCWIPKWGTEGFKEDTHEGGFHDSS